MKFFKQLKAVFPVTIPVLTGYLCLGITYGIYMRSISENALYSVLSSIFIYAGSMEFALVDLIQNVFSILNIIVLTLMINGRHLFYSIAMIPKYKDAKKDKTHLIFDLTDETFAILSSDKKPVEIDELTYYHLVSFLNHCYWIIAVCIGTILASILNINFEGLDFIMTAMFVVVFIDNFRKEKNHFSSLLGILVSFFCLILFGKDYFPLISLLLILFILCISRKKLERKGK